MSSRHDQPPDTGGEALEQSAVETEQLAPVAAGSAATTVWLALLGLITTPYMLNRLGPSAYAVFALVTIMAAYLSNLELGFGQATVRFLARARAEGDSREQAKILQTSFLVFAVAGAGAAAVALAGADVIVKSFADFPPALEAEAVGAIRIAAVLLLLTLLYSFFWVSLQALGRFGALLGYRALFGTLLSLSAVAMAAIFDDVRAVLAAQVVVSAVSCGVAYVALSRAASQRPRPRLDSATFRSMWRFAAFVFATGVAYQLMMQGPATVLAGNASSAELAAFAVPAVVLAQFTLLISASSTGFLPFASAESIAESPARLAAVFRSHLRLLVAVLGLLVAFLVVFADPLLTAWIGGDFATEATEPLQLLAVAGLVLALSAPPSDVARARGYASWTFAYTVAGATSGILAALLLVDDLGASGAALGLLIGFSVPVVPLLIAVTTRLLRQRAGWLVTGLARPVLAVAAIAAVYWLIAEAVPDLWGAVVAGIVATPLWTVALYRIVLDDLERRTLRGGVTRLAPLARRLGLRSTDGDAGVTLGPRRPMS
jgi:O-antigen/teichoic acid export membrane protein